MDLLAATRQAISENSAGNKAPAKEVMDDPFIHNIPIQDRFDTLNATLHTLLPEISEPDRDLALRWLASRLMNGTPANRIPA